MTKLRVTNQGQRLDAFLVDALGATSRSQVKKLALLGNILVNGSAKNVSYKVKKGDLVEISFDLTGSSKLEAWDYPLEILYENDNLLVINKPAGLSVHPAANSDAKTIAQALLAYLKHNISAVSGEMRPGIIHRLDKDTSGCLLVAKNDQAHRKLAEQFKNRTVKKTYLTLVKGTLEPRTGTIDSPIGRSYRDRKKMSVHTLRGRDAITHYKVLEYIYGCSLLEVRIETGRTHQIRAHLAAIGYPVVMDGTYGDKKFNKSFETRFGLKRQFLHAQKIVFKDLDGKDIAIEAPLPSDLAFL